MLRFEVRDRDCAFARRAGAKVREEDLNEQ
jgi:hypothetical protein